MSAPGNDSVLLDGNGSAIPRAAVGIDLTSAPITVTPSGAARDSGLRIFICSYTLALFVARDAFSLVGCNDLSAFLRCQL